MNGVGKSSDSDGAPARLSPVVVLSSIVVAGVVLVGLYLAWARYNTVRFAHDRRAAVTALEMAARVVLEEQLVCPSGWRGVWETMGYIDDGDAFFPESPSMVSVDWSAYCNAIERARLERKQRIEVDERIIMPHE